MGVKVFNVATQAVEEVDPGAAAAGISEGRYTPAQKRVKVKREGQTGEVDASQLANARGHGWELTDEAGHAEARQVIEDHSVASQLAGATEATLAGATLGLSTAAEELLGADPEAMARRRAALGNAGTGLEIAGALGAALASGGASLGATTGRGLAATVLRSTPAGLATRAGARFEGALATRLGSGVGSRILPAGARNFVEGAAQGAGAQLDENVLGDREFNADLLGSSLMGGVFGTGAGLGVQGLASVASGTIKAPVDGMRSILGRMNSSSGGLASRDVAEMVIREGGELSAPARLWRANAIREGVDPEVAERLARMGDTDEGVERILHLQRNEAKIHNDAAELVSTKVNEVHEGLRGAQRYATGESKVRNWERKIPHAPEQRRAAAFAIDDLFAKAKNELDDVIRQNADDADRFRATTHSGPMLKSADGAIGRLHLDLVEAETLTGAQKIARKAAAVDAYKRRLGSLVEENGGWGGMRIATPEVRATNMHLRKMYGEARDLLEREDIFGAAAVGQRDLNAAYRMMAQADDLFEEASKGTGLASVVDTDGTINAGKALKLVRAHGRVGGDVTVMRLMDAMRARVAYVKKIGEHVELDDAGRAYISKVEKSVDDLEREFKRQVKDAADLDDLKSARALEGNKSVSLLTTGTTLAGVLGFGVGGVPGALLGAGLMAARQPHTTLVRYAALRSALNKVDKRLVGTVSGMFDGAAKVGGRIKLPKIELPKLPAGVTGRAATTDGERTTKRETALARAVDLSQSPAALERALAVPLADVHDVAPGLSGVITQRVQKAAAFLSSKAPKVYTRPGSKLRLVDPGAAASFERYLEAVLDPIGALERFNEGRITSETAEAIRVVYPAMYADLQQKIQQHMADAVAEGREIPYSKRVRLGLLFQTPTDPSMNPPTGNEIQLAIGAEFDEPTAAQAMAGANKPSDKAGKIERDHSSLKTSAETAASWRTTA